MAEAARGAGASPASLRASPTAQSTAASRSSRLVVAWLTVSPEIEAERFLSGTHRPWYGDDPEEFLARQAREREPEFRSLDPIVVSTDVASAEEVADAILAGIRERGIELP
jgi:shikimate kinase